MNRRRRAALVAVAALVGATSALQPVLGVATAVLLALFLLVARWRDAVPVLAIALIYSNAVVVLAQREILPTSAGALLVAALGLTVLRDIVQGQRIPTAPPGLAAVLIFGAVQCLSALLSLAPDVAQVEAAESLTQGIVLFLLVAYAVVETRSVTVVVDALVLVGSVMGGLSLLQAVLGDYSNTFYGFADVSNATVPGTPDGEDLRPRLNGNIGETNRYAQVLAVLLPLAIARAASTRSALVKGLMVLAVLLIGSGVVLTYSRGVAVALMATLITLIGMRWLKVRWLGAAVLALVVLFALIPGYSERLTSLTSIMGATEMAGSSEAADNAVRGRTTEVISAIRAFQDHPIVGVGPGVFPLVYPEYAAEVGIRPRLDEREAHNLYAGIAAETGVLGLVALLAVLGGVLRGLARASSRWMEPDPARAWLCRAFFAAVLIYAFTGFFLHLSYARYFWLLVGLAAATARLPGAQFTGLTSVVRGSAHGQHAAARHG